MNVAGSTESKTATAATSQLVLLQEDAWGRLNAVWSDGHSVTGVLPTRAFPWSAPGEFIALLDEQGHEVASLPTLEPLLAEFRALIEQKLDHLEFVPVIRQIHKWSHPYPPCEWSVTTDRGPATIKIGSDDDIRKLGACEALVSDDTGLRYRIYDIEQLDALSRKRLRRLL